MKKKEKKETNINKSQSNSKSLKPPGKETHSGYNEKNPTQPEGAFTPDSKTGKKDL